MINESGVSANGTSHSEKRSHQRRRMLKGGKVIFNKKCSIISCVIKDLSPAGARLSFPTQQALPLHFHLEVNEMGGYDCELVRGAGNEYGVKFVPVSPA